MIDPKNVDLLKRQLEAQLDEYERAVQAAADFMVQQRAKREIDRVAEAAAE